MYPAALAILDPNIPSKSPGFEKAKTGLVEVPVPGEVVGWPLNLCVVPLVSPCPGKEILIIPEHGLTSGTTQRFRGQPTTSPGTGTSTNPVFAFANPGDFDGILGSNIAKAAGYTITTGLYKNGAVDTSDFSVANFFHFTVDTNTATKGGVSGGGLGCSVGPITIEA